MSAAGLNSAARPETTRGAEAEAKNLPFNLTIDCSTGRAALRRKMAPQRIRKNIPSIDSLHNLNKRAAPPLHRPKTTNCCGVFICP